MRTVLVSNEPDLTLLGAAYEVRLDAVLAFVRRDEREPGSVFSELPEAEAVGLGLRLAGLDEDASR